MTTLREKLNYLDHIVDRNNPEKLYVYLTEDLNNAWVYKKGDKEPIKLPKRLINMTYIKADHKVVEILFKEKNEDSNNKVDISVIKR